MFRTIHAVASSSRLVKILLRDQHFFRCARDGVVHDKDGFLPWFTYPAIEMLKSWDLSEKTVLEYGCGYSTLFWAKHARSVDSIEHNAAWRDKILALAPANVTISLRSLKNYHRASGKFDIIVIDGYAQSRMRFNCAVGSLFCLRETGLIIVDNSDWLPATCLYLRRWGLTQIDFSGFVPGNKHTQTTSFFLAPMFDFQHAQNIKPVGGTGYNWEKCLEQELLAEDSFPVDMVNAL